MYSGRLDNHSHDGEDSRKSNTGLASPAITDLTREETAKYGASID
jgi:hypothetical protein